MQNLRELFDCTIHPQGGALLRHDGVAVGLVGGGAPAWDLLATTEQAAVGEAYHRMLLALDAPLDVYVLDQPPALADELHVLRERQRRHSGGIHAAIMAEIEDYLTELSWSNRSRSKQVVWTVTVAGGGAGSVSSALSLRSILHGRTTQREEHNHAVLGQELLARAREKARHLAEALAALRGSPPARLLDAETIARVLYQVADQVRAARYPYQGSILERVSPVVTLPRRGTS